jgi:type IV secretion system protein VirD4
LYIKQVLKYAGYTVITFLLLDYIGALLKQLVDGFRRPYKLPMNFLPFDDMISVISVPKSAFMLFLLTLCIIGLVVFKNHDKKHMDERGFKYSTSGTYGTARWMTDKERDKTFKLTQSDNAEGVILGKTDEGNLICLPKKTMLNKNIAIYGASGSRKSRAGSRPMIFERLRARESMIITDPKGELYRDTSQMLEAAGYVVKVFNLKSFNNSDSWNCLGEIVGEHVDQMATSFTDIVIKNTTAQEFGGNPFWDNAESNLLKALVLYVGHSKHWQGKRTIGEVYQLLSKTSADRLDEMFEQVSISDPCKQPYNIFKQSGTLRPNIILGLATRLQVFQNEVVCKATSLTDIDLLLPGKEPCAYFIIMSDQESTFDFLASLFFSFLFIKLVDLADMMPDGRLPVDTYFIMDEFPNIGQIPDFHKKISTVRSRGICITIIFQTLSQLQEKYPHGIWEVILGNCDTQLFLGCNDETTADYISKRTGQSTIDVTTLRTTKKTIRVTDYTPEFQHSKGDGKRMLMNMDEVMTMDRDELLIIINAKPVLKAKKFDFSEHPLAEKVGDKVHTDHVPNWRMPAPLDLSHLDAAQNTPAAATPAQDPPGNERHKEAAPLPRETENAVPGSDSTEDFGNLSLVQRDGKLMVVDTETGEIRKDKIAVAFLMSMLEDEAAVKPAETITHDISESTSDHKNESLEDLNTYLSKRSSENKNSGTQPPKKDAADHPKPMKPAMDSRAKEVERKEFLPPTQKSPAPEKAKAQEYSNNQVPETTHSLNPATYEKEESVRAAKKIGALKFHQVEYEGDDLADDFVK